MAMLATLEGIEQNRGGILSACLGACNAVSVTMRGCLGSSAIQNWDIGINAIKDDYERQLASQKAYFLGVDAPSIYEQGLRNGQAKNVDNYGGWFYPVQIFIEMFKRGVHDYPELTKDIEVSTKTYYAFIANYTKPLDYEKAVIYDKKLNALREFIAGMGWYDGIKKTELAQKQKAQAAAAAAAASEAAQAYKKAMEQREIEAAEIEAAAAADAIETAEILPETKQNLPQTESGGASSILPILGIAAAAALAFMG